MQLRLHAALLSQLAQFAYRPLRGRMNAKPPSSIHGMRELFANRRIQIHENSRTTALEIFGKSSRTLRAIFQLARFNRYQAKTGFPNEPHADVRLANIAHHSLPEAANPCTLRSAQGHRISVTLRSEVCHTAMLSGKPDARAPMKSHMARVAPKCHGLFGKSDTTPERDSQPNPNFR